MGERRRFIGLMVLSILALLGGGCSLMPSSGPDPAEVRFGGDPSDPQQLPYAFVPITPFVVDVLASYAPTIGRVFTDSRPPKEIRFGVGDVVSVTIFESAAGGLFVPVEAGVRPGNFVNLPNQNVDSRGNISVPYAGLIPAAGRTPAQVQEAIVAALRSRAIEPQAVVALVEQRTSLISVLGDVNTPARIGVPYAGERILDSIARTGGPKSQGFDEWVMLEREGRRATAPFGALVYEPGNNIWTRPGDTIYLYRQPQTFLAFGAVAGNSFNPGIFSGVISSLALPGQQGVPGQQGQFAFDAWRLSLAEAVARAGGLNDALAEPSAVFLYRGETRELAERLGIDCSRFLGPIIPVIYNVNLRNGGAYFLATKFQMRNKDVLYISNATSVQIAKALQYFRLVVASVNDPIAAATNAYNLNITTRLNNRFPLGQIILNQSP
jgi:polysaccharide export outer membrane protein